MAENENAEQMDAGTAAETATEQAPDYKALYEAQAESIKALEAERDKWKSMSRKNETRAKEASSKAGESYEERIAELESLLNAAEDDKKSLQHASDVSGWKAAIANETKLDASILRGDTEEEIRAHAESIRKSIGYPNSASTGEPISGKSVPKEIPKVF